MKMPMKTWKKVVLIILALLVVALIGLYLWQGENIRALLKVLTTDSETIQQELVQVQDDHRKELEESAQITIHVPSVSTQQSEDLLNGKVTAGEVKEQMGYVSEETVPTVSGKEDILNQCIAELYAYKADVMGYLGGLKQEAVSEWNALEKSQRTAAKKAEIAKRGIGKCYDYEVQVDGRVQEILAVYRQKMLDIGEDPTPIDLLWNQYCEEKAAEKSYYFDTYLN